ncbi:hypothetical protein ACFWZ2_23050 [Streptomyces sp. NPDC059002]|uniref:hypothetical protein n=1 Tax=Streptomyces sp. NPDC059002 TaxID=3346690 RepID=UPI00368B20EA
MPMDPYAALHALLRAEAVRTKSAPPAEENEKPHRPPHTTTPEPHPDHKDD